MLEKTYQPADIEARIHDGVDEGRGFQGRAAGARESRALRNRHPAAQRDGLAALGACAQQHAAGRALPLRAHARQGRAVAAGHGPRRHRHADGGRAPADGAPAARPAHAGAREVHREGVGVEGRERRRHHQPAQTPRRLLRLEPRALHHGRGAVAGRPQGVRRSLQRGADLQGQAPRQLGPRVPERAQRPRGRDDRGQGQPVALQVSAGGRPLAVHRRRHHAPRDDAGRHGGGRASRRTRATRT